MKLYPSLTTPLAEWATSQPLFFTASAPTHGRHINVSPKALSAHFSVLGPNLVAYIDRTGSGCETISHSYENGRLTLMFISFGPAPRILRIFCRSRIVEYTDPEFCRLVERIGSSGRGRSGVGVGGVSGVEGGGAEGEGKGMGPDRRFDGARAVVLGEVFEVQTSCGFGVPMVRRELYLHGQGDQHESGGDSEEVELVCKELEVFAERPTLDNWAKKSAESNRTRSYQKEKNSRSLDGLPGLRAARRDAGESVFLGEVIARVQRIRHEKGAVAFGFFLAVVTYFMGQVVKGWT